MNVSRVAILANAVGYIIIVGAFIIVTETLVAGITGLFASTVVLGFLAGSCALLLERYQFDWKQLGASAFIGMVLGVLGLGIIQEFVITGPLGVELEPQAGDTDTLTIIFDLTIIGGLAGVGGAAAGSTLNPIRRLSSGVGGSYPSSALSPERALKKISSGSRKEKELIADAANISITGAYEGTEERVRYLNRTVETTNERCSIPETAEEDLTSIEQIDQGPPSTFVQREYTGVIDETEVTCEECRGSGRSCDTCSGSGRIECSKPKCNNGTFEEECGCASTQFQMGYSVDTGEIHKDCPQCGGDGCYACDQRGILTQTCPNCGGDGIQNKYPCPSCGGSSYNTCYRCDGSGDVDTCTSCEGRGQQVKQRIKTVKYVKGKEERNTMGDQKIIDNQRNIKWIKLNERVLEDGFSELPSPPGNNAVLAQVTEHNGVMYEADVTIGLFDSCKMLVTSGEVIDFSGTPTVEEWGKWKMRGYYAGVFVVVALGVGALFLAISQLTSFQISIEEGPDYIVGPVLLLVLAAAYVLAPKPRSATI